MASKSPFDTVQFPSLSLLPFREGDPDGAIWGFYEHISNAPPGHKDELGALNLLTPSRILKAAQNEIEYGRVCSLNWPLQKPHSARRPFEHNVFRWPGRFVIDDQISMNTQCSSQWDGFRHWGYYKTGQCYNGVLQEDIVDKHGKGIELSVEKPLRNGIHAFQGKIVGRGVLLDYFTYAKENNIQYKANNEHHITAHSLDACARAQGVTFEIGDILFIRMGYVDWYDNATQEERDKTLLSATTMAAGIKQGMEEVEWLWNHHFAAVAADTPAFEARPNTIQAWNLHDYLLALWGTPMGELFDLEELAKTCKELGRYSFFVTSSPLHIINGIASPPNALAIF